MPKHSKKQVARLFDVRTEKSDRFGKRLVDGLIEADHVIKLGVARLTGVRPQAKHAGAQGAVLGDQLGDVEAAARSQKPMRFRRRLRGVEQFGGKPH